MFVQLAGVSRKVLVSMWWLSSVAVGTYSPGSVVCRQVLVAKAPSSEQEAHLVSVQVYESMLRYAASGEEEEAEEGKEEEEEEIGREQD